MYRTAWIAPAILFLASGSTLVAQTKALRPPAQSAPEIEEMVTDRPDFTESASIVHPFWYQLETGMAISWETGRQGKSRSFTLPYPLLRIGISKRLELRYAANGYSRNRFFSNEGQQLSKGFSDIEVGFKFGVLPEGKVLPQVALIGHISEPLGHRSLTSGTIDPKAKICWSKDLPGGWGASGNLNYLYLTEDGKRFLERDTTLSLGHNLIGGFTGYIEYYRLGNISLDKEALSIAQLGWARQIRGNFQFDMSVAKSFAGSTPQWSIMAGFSYRAPLPGMRTYR